MCFIQFSESLTTIIENLCHEWTLKVAIDLESVFLFHFSQLKEEYKRKLAVGLIASLAVLLPVLLPTEQVWSQFLAWIKCTSVTKSLVLFLIYWLSRNTDKKLTKLEILADSYWFFPYTSRKLLHSVEFDLIRILLIITHKIIPGGNPIKYILS